MSMQPVIDSLCSCPKFTTASIVRGQQKRGEYPSMLKSLRCGMLPNVFPSAESSSSIAKGKGFSDRYCGLIFMLISFA